MIAWRLRLPTALDTQGFGKRLAGVLRAGDVLVLSGDLGAGKTTFTQGLGAGTVSSTWPRLSAVAATLTSTIWRVTEESGSSSTILISTPMSTRASRSWSGAPAWPSR